MFKRTLAVITVAGMVFSLASCSKKKPTTRQERERQRAIEDIKKKATKVLKKTEFAAEDAAITAQVMAKYALDDELKTADIKISTEKKVVYLTGSVPSEVIKKKAEGVARGVKDVVGVSNKLTISEEVPENYFE